MGVKPEELVSSSAGHYENPIVELRREIAKLQHQLEELRARSISTEIKTLRLHPTDILVIKVESKVPQEALQRISKTAKSALNESGYPEKMQVLVVTNDLDFAVIRHEDVLVQVKLEKERMVKAEAEKKEADSRKEAAEW